jgi:hypothetical protein
MKKIYFLSLLIILSFFSRAQVFVVATAGTTGPTNYTSLRQAVFSINNGVHQGAITISIAGNTTESIPTIFLQSGVASANYTSILIRPALGIAAVVSGNLAQPMLDFSGADNITIDGLNTDGSSLVFTNTNTSATSGCVRFSDGATNNIIQNCTLSSAVSSVTSGTVIFGISTSTGNSNNMLANNRIGDASTGTPTNAVYSSGSVGLENSNNTISGNLIYNYFNPGVATAGILLAANNNSWTISNNRLYQTTARVFTTGAIHRGIQVSGGNGYTITGNIIGNSDETGAGVYDISGTGVRFTGIELNAGTALATSIQGNRVEHMQMGTSSNFGSVQGIFCGIYIAGGNVNVGTVSGNIIGALSGNGSIRLVPSVTGALATGITYNSSGVADIRNNIVGSIDLLPTGAFSGSIFGAQILGAGAIVTLRDNIFGGNSPQSIAVGVRGTTTNNGLVRGIFTNNNGIMNINYNTIQNIAHNSNSATALFRAIECQVGTITIRGNTINNIAAEGTQTSTATHEGIGILVSTAQPNIIIDSNTISNLSLTNVGAIGSVLSGIYISSNNTGASITRNRLYGFSHASTGISALTPPVAAAIYLREVGLSGELFIANNMISLGSGQNTNTSFIGIWNQVNPAVNYTEKVYHNSINVEGLVTAGANPSFAFYRGNFSATFTGPNLDIKNNIFINNRSGGTGAHFAIANSYGASSSASGWGLNASDYNVLNAADPANIGYWSGNQSFVGWQANSLSDENSLNAVTVLFVDPATDLHLQQVGNTAVTGKGTPLAAVTRDIDDHYRQPLTPDLGADELLSAVPVNLEFFRGQQQPGKNLLEWKTSSTGGQVIFVIERSSDGRSFSPIGTINTSSITQFFSYEDLSPAAGKNYYRLKINEGGAGTYYSAIILLESDIKQISISIRPNIIHNGGINLYVESGKAIPLTIQMVDVTGKLILKKQLSVSAGAGIYPFEIGEIARGIYYLSAIGNGWKGLQKLLVE